jgi:hypothetical protein
MVRSDAMSPLPDRSAPAVPPAAPRSGTVLVVAAIAGIVGVTAYFALGMPGMDHGGGAVMDDMEMGSERSQHRLVDPAGFAVALTDLEATVINVHVPYEGEIAGTDLFMRFDSIDRAALPSDRNAPVLIYCRSGTMSADAAVTLAAMGYTNIVELDGGMNAWRTSGRRVEMDQPVE